MASSERYYFLRPRQFLRGQQLADSLGARTGIANHHNFYFTGANERPQKPRIHGMTEVRGFTPLSWHPKTAGCVRDNGAVYGWAEMFRVFLQPDAT
jgi:hypothetical protein